MRVGVVLPQVAADWSTVLEAARHAEEAGADSVWVIDHLLAIPPGTPPEQGILEGWTLMSALAGVTNRVEIGAQVLCQSFRNPGLLARMAATLDRVSGGRMRLMIGAGWFQREYEAYGFAFPPPGERIGQLRDTVRILKGLLNADEPFTYEGRYHSVHGARNAPPPVRRPVAIEVGGARDRVLKLIAREADGWNCYSAALGAFDERLAVLTRECERVGRNVRDLRLSCQIACAVGDDKAAAHPGLAVYNPQAGLIGSAGRAVQQAGELMDKGVTDFNCVLPPGPPGRACLERLLGEVRPQLLR